MAAAPPACGGTQPPCPPGPSCGPWKKPPARRGQPPPTSRRTPFKNCAQPEPQQAWLHKATGLPPVCTPRLGSGALRVPTCSAMSFVRITCTDDAACCSRRDVVTSCAQSPARATAHAMVGAGHLPFSSGAAMGCCCISRSCCVSWQVKRSCVACRRVVHQRSTTSSPGSTCVPTHTHAPPTHRRQRAALGDLAPPTVRPPCTVRAAAGLLWGGRLPGRLSRAS